MANYTQNYGLHQWEPGDDFLRTDFNQDFAKIDTAVKGLETAVNKKLEEKATVQQLTQGLGAKAELYVGSVMGTKDVTVVNLGFRPRMFQWIMPNGECKTVVDGQPHGAVRFSDTGFQVYTVQTPHINFAGETHYYIALK